MWSAKNLAAAVGNQVDSGTQIGIRLQRQIGRGIDQNRYTVTVTGFGVLAQGELVAIGQEAIKADEIDKLRRVVWELDNMKVGTAAEDEMFAAANIVRG